METLIEGPIPVCEKVFKNTMECEYIHSSKELRKAGDLTHWRFHDEHVHVDTKMEMIMDELLRGKI